MSNTYSAGIVTAYGAAKSAGYTGTYAEFCAEQAQFAENAQSVHDDKESVESTVNTFVNTTVPAKVAEVTAEGTTQIGLVTAEGATQVGLVTAEGTTQVGLVTAEGTTQIGLVEAKGEETLESIPDDYTALSAEVTGLNTALDAFTITENATGTPAAFEDGADGIPVAGLTIDIDYSSDGYTGATVARSGKNLFDAEEIVETSNHSSYCYISDGYLVYKTGYNPSYGFKWTGLNFPCPLAFHGTVKNLDTSNTNTIQFFAKYDDGSIEDFTVLTNLAANTSASFSITIGSSGQTVTQLYSGYTSNRNAGLLISDTQLEFGEATDYEEFSGSEKYAIDWSSEAGTIYGGTWDVTNGIVTSTYNSDGTELATPVEYSVDALAVTTLLGYNNIWANTGDTTVSYYADTKTYVDIATGVLTDDLSAMEATTVLTTSNCDFDFVLGTLYNGNIDTSSTRIRSDYIRLGVGSIIKYLGNTKCMVVYEYDEQLGYVSDSGWVDGDSYTVRNDGYVRIVIRKDTSNSTISSDEIATIASYLSVYRFVPQSLVQSAVKAEYRDTMSYLYSARQIPRNATTPLTIMHFSDIHADYAETYPRILADANKYADYIDDMICTGDMTADIYGEISGWWDSSVLTCIGNHDTLYNGDWIALSMADRDAYYIAPFEENWGITHTSGTSYYYKDYSDASVRLIVIDVMLYMDDDTTEADTQTSWLADILDDAITNSLHVLIATHAPHGGATAVDCSFTKYGATTMATNSDCNTPQTVIDTVASAITSGLNFVGYLCGHTHQDYIWDAEGDGTQLMYCVTCAADRYEGYWYNSDQYRGRRNDAYNLITIDTENTLVKIIRCGGADIDIHMRPRKAICFDYSTGTKVGEVL